MEKKYIDYRFKILYAVAIIAVLCGHCNNGGISLFFWLFPPYSFHLGLFVFASGYFYKKDKENKPLEYIAQKTRRLIIPLYLWNCFYLIITYLFGKIGIAMTGMDHLFKKLIILPITTGHQFIYNLSGWFVIPLFMVEVFNVIFRKIRLIKNDNLKDFIYFIIYLLLGFCSVYLASKNYNTGWWLVLLRFLFFLPFYGLGIMYKSLLEKYDNKIDSILYFSIVLFIQLVVLIIFKQIPNYSIVWQKSDNYIIFIPFLISFNGIAFWLRVSKILEPSIGKSKLINLIADNTYTIMINHLLGFMLVKGIYAIIAKYTNLIKSFDFNQFKTNIWYYYYPKQIGLFGILYLAAGIIIPIIMQKIVNVIWKTLKLSVLKKEKV